MFAGTGCTQMASYLTRRNLIVGAAILSTTLVLWYAFAGGSAVRAGYETKAIDTGQIERVVSASGPVNAVVTVEVGTQVSGQIAVLDADFNSQVKKGQRLALIDPQTFQSRVVQAESDLAAARTQKALQDANVTRANAQLVKEQRALDRLVTLGAKGFASPAQLDAQKAVIASAQADVSVAKAQVQNAQANIAAKEAALAQAKIDLSRTVIESPIDGIVIERNVDRGQTVAASLSAPVLFKIAQDLSQVQIEAQVDEADIGGVKEGQNVTFTVGAYAQREFRGRVAQVRVGGLNEQSVVTYAVIISAPNRNLDLLPGMTASVKISTGRRDNALRLPNEALRFRPPAALQTSGQAERRSGQGAARRETLIAELTKELSLSESQQAVLKESAASATPRRRNGGGNGESGAREGGEASADGGVSGAGAGGSRGGRGGFDRALTAALEPTLTAEQKAKLEAWRESRGRTQRAQVWVMRSGTPVQVPVTLGINDDRFSEIVGGDLKEGDLVVTRYVEPGV